MNCEDFQSQIVVQWAEGRPTTQMVAHTHKCAACRKALEERMQEQQWLRERFDKVSTWLLSEAPPFSAVAFWKTTERPFRMTLLWGAAAVLIVTVASIGWWQRTNGRVSESKSAATKSDVDQEFAGQLTPKVRPNVIRQNAVAPAAKPKVVLEPNPAPRNLAAKQIVPATSGVPGQLLTTEPRVAAAHIFKMTPTAFAPNADGYLATIIPNDAASQAPAMLALSLTGLPPESLFHIRARDSQGRPLWLASLITDASGSGATMLRSAATTTLAERPLTALGNRTSLANPPTIPLDLGDDDSPPGGNLDVVDDDGNVAVTVSPTKHAAQPKPTPTPAPTP